MGLIKRIFGGGLQGVGQTVSSVAEVFVPNKTRRQEIGHEAFQASLSQYAHEFERGGNGFFDNLVNGLNRLPRPLLALGTLGLFVFAMVDPVQFATRMEGLAYVPDPLWWLLGAIVSFYFGARELHYRRRDLSNTPQATSQGKRPNGETRPRTSTNAALEAWRARRGG